MRRLRHLLICLIMTVLMAAGVPMTAFAKPDWPSDTGIESEAGIVMDADSGAVLFGQNIHVQKAPASITKILTALVVVENGRLDDTVTFSHDAVYNVEEGSGNKNAIEEGDQMTVRDCLYLLLMRSSNQAANALAEHVGGSREGFVEMMNRKTEELGCQNSHFANPSGLNDETQLTSVYDMALIAAAVYKNDTLLSISSDKSYRLPATKNNPDGVTIRPEHKLLITTDKDSPNYYPYAVAGKTGYTSIAGQTLVTYAVKDDRRLIAVTMKSTQATHYQDTIALLDFGFQRFKNIPIAENETAYTSGDQEVEIGSKRYQPSDLSMDASAVITVPNNATFADAEKTVSTELSEAAPQGAVALISYKYNDRKIGQVYLISASQGEAAADSVQETGDETQQTVSGTEASGQPQKVKNSFHLNLPKWSARTTMIIALSALLVLACAVLAGLVYRQKREEKKRQEERKNRRRQRLQEIGCSQEEFEKLLEKRMGSTPPKSTETGDLKNTEKVQTTKSNLKKEPTEEAGNPPVSSQEPELSPEKEKETKTSSKMISLKEKIAQREAERAKKKAQKEKSKNQESGQEHSPASETHSPHIEEGETTPAVPPADTASTEESDMELTIEDLDL